MSATSRRAAAIALMAGAFVMVGTTASFAIGTVRNWNSQSSPLRVDGYGSTGWGYGTWKVSTGSDGTRSRLYAQVKIHNVDNHKVFAKLWTQTNAGYCFQPDYTSCNMQYYDYDDSDTGHTANSSWTYEKTTTGLESGGNYARAKVQVKLDIPYRTDPASNPTYTKGDSY